MTHRGLVRVKEELAVRVNPSNFAHHLWNNNGTWFIHYTVYPNRLTARRVRKSLKTKSLQTAIKRRDQVLAADQVFEGRV